MRRLWLGLRALLLPNRVERELHDELAFHLDMHVKQLVDGGMPESDARESARRAFGNRGRHMEHVRDARYLAWLEELARDIGFAIRSLRRRPAFAAVTIAVLALGIGANTTILSAVNAVLFQHPPYENPDRLAFVWQTNSVAPGRFQVPAPDIADYRTRTDVFEMVAFAANATDGLLQYGDRAEHTRVGVVTSNLFDVLGIDAAVGRTFLPGEAEISAVSLADTTFVAPPSVAMLSHGVWVGRFGADSSVVGRNISIGRQQLAVVGVLPASFALRTPAYAGYAADIDVWTPLRIDVSLFSRPRRRDLDSDNTGIVIARLAPGATFDRAQSAMTAVASAQREQSPSYREAGVEIEVVPLQDDLVAQAKPALLALQGAVGLVLLIACINVATMLAARGSSRRQELAVRTALGAGRGRLIRQLLSEALVIAAIAGIVGIILAAFATGALSRIGAVALPAGTAIRVDAPVLAITILVSLAAALLAGVMPAVFFSAKRFTHALGERSSSGGLMQSRIGRALVVSQLALSVALLAGAGLLLRSFGELHRVEPGFDPNGLVMFQIDLAGASLGGPAARAAFVSDLEERVRQLPGVEAIGLTNAVPLSGTEWSQPYGLPGETEAEWERNSADFRMITSEYFTTMGIGFVAGRTFTAEEDVMERERIVIVDRTLATNIDPSGDVLGRRIGFPLDGAPISAEIVGIVENIRHTSLRSEGRETIYVPYRQEASRSVAMAVRTSRDVRSLATALQGELRTIDAMVPVFDFTLMETHVNNALAPTRFVMTLVAGFAVLSLVLAASGLYGLLSFAVLQRKRELGVRLALGAVERDIVALVVRGGMLLVLAGLAVGIPVSLITSRALTRLLYTVSPWDPLTLLAVGVLLTAVAALACYVPARRAGRIDPMRALRVE